MSMLLVSPATIHSSPKPKSTISKDSLCFKLKAIKKSPKLKKLTINSESFYKLKKLAYTIPLFYKLLISFLPVTIPSINPDSVTHPPAHHKAFSNNNS